MKKRIMILGVLLWAQVFPALSETIRVVKTKGLVFKDKIEVQVFDDPTIQGVSCYTTAHKRALSFVDSSSVSLACRQTGKIIGELKDLKNVFSNQKSIFFKKTVVDRFYDRKRNVLIYLTYTKDWGNKKNNSHSISTVVIRPW